MTGRQFAQAQQLAGVVAAAYGPRRRLANMQRLAGGSKKGTYRLRFADAGTAVLHVWSAAENYWPGQNPDAGTVFADASGYELFLASHAVLESAGVAVPRVEFADGSLERYPAEFALVEDLPGGKLEDLLRREPTAAAGALDRFAEVLVTMHAVVGDQIGKVGLGGGGVGGGLAGEGAGLGGGRPEADMPAERVVLERALRDLRFAAGRVEQVRAVAGRLEEVTRELAAGVAPRAEHRLIHGELGPDHVLLRADGSPVLIDIEGAMFFDVEWEHAFLALRFGEHYRWLAAEGLDPRRLRFYRLALSLSLIAGPLRLLAGDYPDRDPFLRIIEANTTRALAFLD
ncbi:MAG TPA: phosphotransferase [Streptosporangiaceae bacterium]